MPSLTLKNVPARLLRALRKAAEIDRRSLNQQVIHLLELSMNAGSGSGQPPAGVEAQLAAWRRLAGKWESELDRATEARRLADQRTSGREVDV